MNKMDAEDEATLAEQFARYVLANPGMVRVYLPKRKDGAKYAYVNVTVPVHRVLMAAPKGMEVDHINRDGLDNRRANLRLTDSAGNKANQRRPLGKSGLQGVRKVGHRWRADAPQNLPCKRHIGYFDTAEDAYAARQIVVARHMQSKHGESHG